jgi:hypothetical protein
MQGGWGLALLAGGLVAGALIVAAAAHGLPRLLTKEDSTSFAIRPQTIGYTEDGTGAIGRFPRRKPRGSLDWRGWTYVGAYAVGTIWLDDCRPDCADGKFHPFEASVLADHVRNGVFTRITLHYWYYGRRVTDIRTLHHYTSDPLDHDSSYYAWVMFKHIE